MLLYFYTQDYENYGTPEDPYWKPKGGSDYILEADEWTEEMIHKIVGIVNFANPMFESSLIGYQEVCKEFKTDFEQMQLEHDGSIEFPANRMKYDEMQKLFS